MPITRRFIDWQQPALVAVVAELVAKNQVMGFCDLSGMTVVFPGHRAARRFLELLAGRTQNRNVPPEVITVGDLPEKLYRPQKPFADELTQRLAWKLALRNLPHDLVREVIPHPPEDKSVDAWLHIGEMLAKLHRELAADRLRFADVLTKMASKPEFTEAGRWQALSEIQAEYLRILDGLQLWDQQTARLVAIEQRECQTRQQIVLVGTVDMNQTLRQMLDQVAEQVTVYIHAPPDLKWHFDPHGCLEPRHWVDRPIELLPEQMVLADKPADQSQAIATHLAGLNGSRRVDEITIGVADDTLVPTTQQVLSQSGVTTRWVAGQMFRDSPLAHLLRGLVEYLETRQTQTFAAFVRHPDVAAWLAQQGADPTWVIALDKYISEHFPSSLGHWLGLPERSEPCRQAYDLIETLIAPLLEPARLAEEWAEPLIEWLLTLYAHREFHREVAADAAALDACERFVKALKALQNLPESLAPSVSAAQALRLALESLDRQLIPPSQHDEALELLGWLELPLDDAQELIVAGFNEGSVPSSLNSDLFLPNSLRSQLGMTDNSRRLARDVYALTAILHSRRRVTLIAGRSDPRGDALRPSRLWFAADPETVAKRIQTFYGESNVAFFSEKGRPFSEKKATSDDAISPPPRLTVPRPDPERSFEGAIPVTGFSAYLASPYRFYLGHVLKLRTLDDDVEELDARDFGNLLHSVLKGFGRSDWKHSKDEAAISRYLDQQLDISADLMYGGDPLFPVQIQIEQARDRLKAFAAWQAKRALDGWEIIFTEKESEVTLALDDERAVQIHGKIDRIDRHRDDHRWAILDYKTGEQRRPPREVHYAKGQWVDLQLPLYRLLAEPHGVTGDVQLGYISIPRDNDRLECLLADWSEEELHEAEAVARLTASRILNREFRQILDRPPISPSEFSPICQDGVLDREVIV
jgi:ATP-dependent helicase/nuclease subunit B